MGKTQDRRDAPEPRPCPRLSHKVVTQQRPGGAGRPPRATGLTQQARSAGPPSSLFQGSVLGRALREDAGGPTSCGKDTFPCVSPAFPSNPGKLTCLCTGREQAAWLPGRWVRSAAPQVSSGNASRLRPGPWHTDVEPELRGERGQAGALGPARSLSGQPWPRLDNCADCVTTRVIASLSLQSKDPFDIALLKPDAHTGEEADGGPATRARQHSCLTCVKGHACVAHGCRQRASLVDTRLHERHRVWMNREWTLAATTPRGRCRRLTTCGNHAGLAREEVLRVCAVWPSQLLPDAVDSVTPVSTATF